jgi:hypothetical protein
MPSTSKRLRGARCLLLCAQHRNFLTSCNQAVALKCPAKDHDERNGDLYEAAGAADAIACSRIGSL